MSQIIVCITNIFIFLYLTLEVGFNFIYCFVFSCVCFILVTFNYFFNKKLNQENISSKSKGVAAESADEHPIIKSARERLSK